MAQLNPSQGPIDLYGIAYLDSRIVQYTLLSLLLVFLLSSATVIKRLLFHPLTEYPGPFIAKFTNLYAGYHAWKGDIHIDIYKCHEKYGKYVRYAPDRLVVNTADALRDIYSHGSNVRKSKLYDVLVHGAPNTLTVREKVAHSRKRKCLGPGFSPSALINLESKVMDQVKKFCAQVCQERSPDGVASSKWTPARNMSHWCNYLMFDIMTNVIFGRSYDTLGSPQYRNVISAIEQSNVRMSILYQFPELGLLRLDKLLFPDAIRGRNTFLNFVGHILRATFAAGEVKGKTIFSFISQASNTNTGKIFGTRELGAEGTTLIVAGSDTTSTTLAATFFYLSRHPEIYDKLQQEIRGAFATADDIRSGPRLSSCSYLRACINETLRMSPSVGGVLWREVQAGGARINGKLIPAGYDVGTGLYSIHHNPEYHPQPFQYRPERWIDDGNSAMTEDGNSSSWGRSGYAPFSQGPRACIGQNLAMLELRLTLATVIFQFDFRAFDETGGIGVGHGGDLNRGSDVEFKLREHVTAGGKDGPLLQFKQRGDMEL